MYEPEETYYGKEQHQQEQIILQHGQPEIPWYFGQDFQWWWTGVFVPIILAIVINKTMKKKTVVNESNHKHPRL